MKHLKEFQLNEYKHHDYRYGEEYLKNKQNINLESIKNILIGELTEEFEYTDNVWTNPKVQKFLQDAAQEIMSKFHNILDDISNSGEYRNLNMYIDEVMGINQSQED